MTTLDTIERVVGNGIGGDSIEGRASELELNCLVTPVMLLGLQSVVNLDYDTKKLDKESPSGFESQRIYFCRFEENLRFGEGSFVSKLKKSAKTEK